MLAATSSMSMPPSLEAISTTRCERAVHHHADVELLVDIGAFLDQQALHDAAFGPGLMGDQAHAENVRRVLPELIGAARKLHTPALAAPAGMDLGLDDPD